MQRLTFYIGLVLKRDHIVFSLCILHDFPILKTNLFVFANQKHDASVRQSQVPNQSYAIAGNHIWLDPEYNDTDDDTDTDGDNDCLEAGPKYCDNENVFEVGAGQPIYDREGSDSAVFCLLELIVKAYYSCYD